MKISLCNDWEFTPSWSQEFLEGQGQAQTVRLPHNVHPLPLHYGDSQSYQTICGYRRRLDFPYIYAGKRIFLQFDGAGHIATVYVNGKKIAHHRTGYTAFRVELTEHITLGQSALIAVELDTTENPSIPPFGFVVDYLTHGGLYREAWLDVRNGSVIEDVFITTPTLDTLHVEVTTQGSPLYRLSVLDGKGKTCFWKEFTGPADVVLPNARPWCVEDPYRYCLLIELIEEEDNMVVDRQEIMFGFRTISFRTDGFYLNGKKVFLRGLNRHQCYPYIGYAATESLQREDARILKEELGCVAVRTSHYPQSQYFIDECDRLGLLVFTEIPGWQHIGDAAWKAQACENIKEMVLQYRNHPSIVLWGVRINESGDDDDFYRETNRICHALDPSRPTSGVRCMDKSSLLEDVYARNDFSHIGTNAGVRPKKHITPDMQKPYLVTEHNGHMFPTKAFDPWQRRQEHALRHARVQNDSAASGESCGCFGWCMFDYATHQDFGSGDRICYHGVMDAFRNPKLAASVYASQQEAVPVLELGSSMDIGDYSGGLLGDTYIFTNADTVSLYRDGEFVTRFYPEKGKGLPHVPILMHDTIGCLLETREGFQKKKARALAKCLMAVSKYDYQHLPFPYLLRLGWCMLRYGLRFQDGVALYGKYVANWGAAATVWRLDAEKDGAIVASITRTPSTQLQLQVTVSKTHLKEAETYDMAAIRIRILDENGCAAPYAQLPVRFHLEGDAQLEGPDTVTAEGGMCGTYIRTTGSAGKAKLTILAGQAGSATLDFTIEKIESILLPR